MTENSAVALMLGAIGGALLSGAVQVLLDKPKPLAVVAVVVGLSLLVVSAFFSKLTGVIPSELLTSARGWATNFRVWFVMFAALWFYLACTSLLATWRLNGLARVVEEQIAPFQSALEKWAVPRQLSKDQLKLLTEALAANQPRCVVRIEMEANDSEAQGYASHLSRALRDGGWRLTRMDNVKDLREGLNLNVKLLPDAGRPTPDRVLQDAFEEASIFVDGMSGGGSTPGLAENEILIQVGPRPRGPYARPVRHIKETDGA